MKPPRSILDPAFKWTPSAKQDCAATFRRIRREQAESQRNVTVLKQPAGAQPIAPLRRKVEK